MKKPLIALFAIVFTLPFGCSSEEEDPPNPLAERAGFCKAWAQAACEPEIVLRRCNTTSVEDCEAAQRKVCLDIVPVTYSAAQAESCVEAVRAAYSDGELSAEELGVVRNLAAPCDTLSTGTSGDGDTCVEAADCDTAGGFSCVIKLGSSTGICAKPEIVGVGEECEGAKQVCGEGYYCNGNCVVYRKTGTGACEGDYQCKPVDRCVVDEDDAEAKHCQPRLARGELCADDADCQSGICVIDSGTEGECVETIVLSRNEPLCADLGG